MVIGLGIARDAFFALEDRGVKLVLGEAKPFRRGDELPGEGDGLFFEIVSEREVTQHLEKGVVAVGEPYIFEVVVLAAGANTLLNGGGARVIAPLEAQEDILELVHPGIGE